VAEASDYFLSEEELRTLFEEDVLDFVFGQYEPQSRPLLVLSPAARRGRGRTRLKP
jgi:hypothetical protein